MVSVLAIATLVSAAAVGVVRSENMSSHNRMTLSQAATPQSAEIGARTSDADQRVGGRG